VTGLRQPVSLAKAILRFASAKNIAVSIRD
jgi:hypothetical protein